MSALEKDTFCPKLWNSIQIYPNGFVTVCCLWDKWFGKIQDIGVDRISDYLTNNVELQELRRKALAGEEIEFCKYCYKEEKLLGNRQSTRGFYIQNSTLSESEVLPDTKHTIQFFDYRLSNKCNLMCRSCIPFCSSMWEKKLGEPTDRVDPKKIRAVVEEVKGSKDIKELYFAGGEPFIVDETWEIIKHFISEKRTGINLRFNTNLTKLSYKKNNIIGILKEWLSLGNTLLLNVSFDGVKEVNDYCRTGSSWKTLDNNLRKIRKGLDGCVGDGVNRIVLTPTVSLMNILHLVDLIKYAHNSGVECYIGNILSRPRYYSIRSFPENKKDLILNTLCTQLKGYDCEEMRQLLTFTDNELAVESVQENEIQEYVDFYSKDPLFNKINPELSDWYLQ